MKKLFFLVSLLFVLFFQANLYAGQCLSPQIDGAMTVMKAADYCCFLNCVATTDAYHLYNDKMGLSSSGLISRTGNVGNYHYQIVNGKEESPMRFISKLSAAFYFNATKGPSSTFVSNTPSMDYDELLQSSSFVFYDTTLKKRDNAAETENVYYFSQGVICTVSALMIISQTPSLFNRSFSNGENALISNPRETHRLPNTSRQGVLENHPDVVMLEPQNCAVWNRNMGAFVPIFGVTMKKTEARERVLKRKGLKKMVSCKSPDHSELTGNFYIKEAEAIPVQADQATIITGQIVE